MAQFPDSKLFKGLDVREKKTRQALYHIEALRAASRIVAGHNDGVSLTFESGQKVVRDVDGATLRLAEQFARWLEKGER